MPSPACPGTEGYAHSVGMVLLLPGPEDRLDLDHKGREEEEKELGNIFLEDGV